MPWIQLVVLSCKDLLLVKRYCACSKVPLSVSLVLQLLPFEYILCFCLCWKTFLSLKMKLRRETDCCWIININITFFPLSSQAFCLSGSRGDIFTKSSEGCKLSYITVREEGTCFPRNCIFNMIKHFRFLIPYILFTVSILFLFITRSK